MSLPDQCPHGVLLRRKSGTVPKLSGCLIAYEAFVATAAAIEVTDAESVAALTEAFNVYREAVIYIFEGGSNVPQENLRSTMVEEFLGWLFKDIFIILGRDRPENYLAGKAMSSYLTLTFAPKNFPSLFDNPNPRISRKDQDFAIGAVMNIAIGPPGASDYATQSITIPVVAIECKTYLAKNHLDMCSSTAQMLKRANPYCMYIIATEFLKMDKGVTPEVTDIAEIFLLCKADNASRAKRKVDGDPPHAVYGDVVQALFQMVVGHLQAVWWDPDTALERGKVISRPF